MGFKISKVLKPIHKTLTGRGNNLFSKAIRWMPGANGAYLADRGLRKLGKLMFPQYNASSVSSSSGSIYGPSGSIVGRY